jgi:hypothetical protein
MSNHLTAFAASLCCLLSGAVRAGDKPAPADKSHYTLFSPTPANLLREFDTARPDHTDSPHTIDAGHLQLETDIFSYTHDRHNSDRSFVRNDNWTFANANFRLGLTNWADIEFVVPFFQVNRDKDTSTGIATRQQGIGDLSVVLKMNFWGNDGGKTSGGLELFVKAPTANHNLGNGKTEGGALLLYGFGLPGDFDAGINSGVSINADDTGDGHHAELINSISVSRKIADPLSAYAEFWSDVSMQSHAPAVATADFGLLLMLGKNVQLDTGVNIGVTRAAPDIQTVFGVSVRF